MKKTLLGATLLVAIAASTTVSNAFDWRYMNPANWGTCPRCEKVCQKETCKCKTKCRCKKEKYNPCKKQTCDPCKKHITEPCNPCDKLQEQTEK